MANTVKITCAYAGTSDTRQYAWENVDVEILPSVKTKIKAINASLAGGTAGGLSSFYVSDDGDNLLKITKAQIIQADEYPVDLEVE